MTAEYDELKKSVLHLMVDAGLFPSRPDYAKLSAVLSERLNHKITRNTLSMALTGYRTTPPYVAYLTTLKTYLEECRQNGEIPVTLYTEKKKNQQNLITTADAGIFRTETPSSAS